MVQHAFCLNRDTFRACWNHIITHGSASKLTCLGFQLNTQSRRLCRFFFNYFFIFKNQEEKIKEAFHSVGFLSFTKLLQIATNMCNFHYRPLWQASPVSHSALTAPCSPCGCEGAPPEQRPHLHISLYHDPFTPCRICWKWAQSFLGGKKKLSQHKLH